MNARWARRLRSAISRGQIDAQLSHYLHMALTFPAHYSDVEINAYWRARKQERDRLRGGATS